MLTNSQKKYVEENYLLQTNKAIATELGVTVDDIKYFILKTPTSRLLEFRYYRQLKESKQEIEQSSGFIEPSEFESYFLQVKTPATIEVINGTTCVVIQSKINMKL